MIDIPTSNLAQSLGLTEQELWRQALISLVQEKKRQVALLMLEQLSRYGVTQIAALEAKIAQGQVSEHPAWEDLIVAENLQARLGELDAHLERLQQS